MTETTGQSALGLVGSIVDNIQAIIRAEIQLAGVELRSEGQRLLRAAVLFVAAAWLVTLGFAWLLYMFIVLLSAKLALWASALIVSGVVLIAGGAVGYAGLANVRRLKAPLARTKRSLQEVMR